MAIYRHIHIDYWQDGFVLDLTPEEKYFYIYLMTNSKTSQCGIYELPKRIMETESGYNRETVEKLIKRFETYEKIVYCEETKEIFIKNWIKHNKIVSPKVKKCVEKELSNVKSKYLIELFLKECDKYGYNIDKEFIPKSNENLNIDKIKNYANLYEQNVGVINGIVAQWLIEVSENIELELFKKAIEIATDRGKCNKGYIKGILKQWNDNNINTITDLCAYEVSIKNKGDKNNGKYKYEPSKPKYARELEEEDESIYKKPSEEQMRQARKWLHR